VPSGPRFCSARAKSGRADKLSLGIRSLGVAPVLPSNAFWGFPVTLPTATTHKIPHMAKVRSDHRGCTIMHSMSKETSVAMSRILASTHNFAFPGTGIQQPMLLPITDSHLYARLMLILMHHDTVSLNNYVVNDQCTAIPMLRCSEQLCHTSAPRHFNMFHSHRIAILLM
jgi:hypothetical protein